MRLWKNDPKYREGKYPVLLRRDGTIPPWPHFAIGARDPCAPLALHAYADAAESTNLDPAFVADVRRLAVEFATYREAHGHGDPDGKPHRRDDPLTLALARGEVTMADLAALLAACDSARRRLVEIQRAFPQDCAPAAGIVTVLVEALARFAGVPSSTQENRP